MAFTLIKSNAYRQLLYEIQHGAAAKPGNYFALLLNSAAFSEMTTMAELVAAELSATNGYTRKAFLPLNPAFASGRYYGTAQPSWTVTAAETVNAVAVIAHGLVTPGNTQGTIYYIGVSDAPVTLVANLAQQFDLIGGIT
ncbi:MAG: hypothetical protein ACRCVX_00605 [Shewanella sp.]